MKKATVGLGTSGDFPIHILRSTTEPGWFQDLQQLQILQDALALLPVGWGNEWKGPMLAGWQMHKGFSIAELQATKGIRSVGARTGLHTGPLLCFDFDGASSFDLGLNPATVASWQVHRDTDPHRLKVLFRPTLEQLNQLPGGAEFQGKTITGAATDTSKGEALEVFLYGGRQVNILGEHPSSGGHYLWPAGMGPEALAPPPADWWAHALLIAQNCQQRMTAGSKPSSRRHGTRRLNPCPICGRHDGPGGSGLWCEQTQQGLILCMPGTTFSAEKRHERLIVGRSVINGYELVKRTPIQEGDVLTFASSKRSLRPCRRWRHG